MCGKAKFQVQDNLRARPSGTESTNVTWLNQQQGARDRPTPVNNLGPPSEKKSSFAALRRRQLEAANYAHLTYYHRIAKGQKDSECMHAHHQHTADEAGHRKSAELLYLPCRWYREVVKEQNRVRYQKTKSDLEEPKVSQLVLSDKNEWSHSNGLSVRTKEIELRCRSRIQWKTESKAELASKRARNETCPASMAP